MPHAMTAEFPLPQRAEAFYTYITSDPSAWFMEPGSIRLDGCQVVWRTDSRADAELAQHVLDMRGTIGAFGSSQTGPVATLNGHPCRGGW